jgi:hypothetical protein
VKADTSLQIASRSYRGDKWLATVDRKLVRNVLRIDGDGVCLGLQRPEIRAKKQKNNGQKS